MTGDAGAVRRTRGVPQGRVSSSGTITHGRPGQDAILTVTFVALLLLPGVPAVQFRIIVATGIFGVRPALRPQRTQRPRSSSSSRRAATIWCTREHESPAAAASARMDTLSAHADASVQLRSRLGLCSGSSSTPSSTATANVSARSRNRPTTRPTMHPRPPDRPHATGGKKPEEAVIALWLPATASTAAPS